MCANHGATGVGPLLQSKSVLVKSLFTCWILVSLLTTGSFAVSAQGVGPPAATMPAYDDHNPLHQETRLNAQATDEARKLARALHLNEVQYIQLRAFDYARLHSLTEAEARFATKPEERLARNEQAAAAFQAHVVNMLNDEQLTTYFELMARDARRSQAREAQQQQTISPAPKLPAGRP